MSRIWRILKTQRAQRATLVLAQALTEAGSPMQRPPDWSELTAGAGLLPPPRRRRTGSGKSSIALTSLGGAASPALEKPAPRKPTTGWPEQRREDAMRSNRVLERPAYGFAPDQTARAGHRLS